MASKIFSEGNFLPSAPVRPEYKHTQIRGHVFHTHGDRTSDRKRLGDSLMLTAAAFTENTKDEISLCSSAE